MRDEKEYKGHTPAPWDKLSEYCPVGSIDKQLIADAPLLLAEVKRLRKQLVKANKFVHSICQHTAPMMMDSEDYIQTRYFAGKGDDEE